jgi:hypothetical protein
MSTQGWIAGRPEPQGILLRHFPSTFGAKEVPETVESLPRSSADGGGLSHFL